MAAVHAVRIKVEQYRVLLMVGEQEIIAETVLGRVTVVSSPCMRALMDRTRRIAQTPASVLILGETGTGKEHVARAIHHFSLRCNGPWVDINCGAVPEHLLESELFGHEKGAFSGATGLKQGLVEVARGGTLFLDEIAELDPKMQVKLLRVLDGIPYYRVGGVSKVTPDVRIVAATNQNLDQLIEAGRFRSDLYHRLSQVTVKIPPLRERKEDVLALARLFLNQMGSNATLSESAQACLLGYTWPGNAREIKNVLTTALVDLADNVIEAAHLPGHITGLRREEPQRPAPQNLAELEKIGILEAVKKANGNQSRAASMLGISSRTLYRKLKSYRQEEAANEKLSLVS
jgi:transcriptional regulator with PAS, ATPase and Fis domain